MTISNFKFQISNLKSFYCLLFTAYCLLLFTGCAASTQQIKKQGEKEKTSIEKITVVGNGKDILIEASGTITYTAFKLSDPARLVLDIPGVDVEKVRKPVNINNEFITTITAASYGEQTTTPIARIEIGLKQGIAHEVKQGEGSIMVVLNHESALQQEASAVEAPAAAGQTASELPPATEPLQQEVAKKEEPAAISEEVKLISPAAEKLVPEGLNRGKESKKADKLLRIDARKENGATVIRIVGNGAIGDFNAFDMDKPAPPRLVVDIWNVGSSVAKTSMAVNTSQIKKVRIGEYPNKIRLVFDANQKALFPYTIERIEDSLIITAGKTGVKKQETAKASAPQSAPEPAAATAAPQPPAVAAAAPEPVSAPEAKTEIKPEDNAEVKGVDFKQLSDKARIVLTLSKKAAYKLSKSADETNLILDIKNTVIAEEFRKTLDASDLNTPVATISSFPSPAESAKDVRILVKLKEKADYNISQQGEKIQIDFPLLAVAQTAPKKAEIKSQESGVRSQELKEVKPTAEEAAKKEPEQASGYAGRKISLDFKDADISNILRLMAEVGLGKVQEGNVIRIMPVAKIKQESEEVLASRKAKEKLEDLEIKLVPISYATASSLESQIKGLLSDRGTVSIESRTNTLVIKDIPANIKNAVDLIKKLDTQTPQVLIEARIIEAQSNFARDLGVQWGASHTTTRGTPEGNRFGSVYGNTAANAPVTTLSRPGYAVNLPAAGGAGPLGAMGFAFGKLTGDPLLLDLRISAGEKNGLTKVVSRPRITTLDNKEAKISQGDSVPFETTSSSGTQTSFIDATLELTVTPHITPDGSISMKINAKRNSIGSFRSATGTPSISKKEAVTEIIVKNGETTVIGGIVVADKSETDSGVPWLKDIPLFGWFFKNKSVADSQTELLIFITPNIVNGKVEITS
ncbi:MAG: type IV pilus secretin PilQ [Deltaproteobacteria bacterium]|nr:type IV pilus secretin PilQ [Deltaproteobacteria bacterium]